MYEMVDQRATTKPAMSVKDNNLLCREIEKRNSARLREYKTRSRIASSSQKQTQIRTSLKDAWRDLTTNNGKDCPIKSRSYDERT